MAFVQVDRPKMERLVAHASVSVQVSLDSCSLIVPQQPVEAEVRPPGGGACSRVSSRVDAMR